MDKSEEIIRQAVKSVSVPELSPDFTPKVMEEIYMLPKPKPFKVKPLINPYTLWSILTIIVILTIYYGLKSDSSEVVLINFQNLMPAFNFLKSIVSNYLIIAYTSLILIWFLIDYRFINFGRIKSIKYK